MKKGLMLFIFSACIAVLLSACGGGGENISPAQLLLNNTPTSLLGATVNLPYNQTVLLTASGGTPPYQYSCSVSNASGLSASVSSAGPITGDVSCVITGTPLAVGAAALTISVSDSRNASASASPMSINIKPSTDPLANWHWRNPLPQGNALNAVSYGNKTFVAVGGSGAIITSPDSVTWTSMSSGITANLSGVTYGNCTFAAVGEEGAIVTSSDSITWTSRSSGTNNPFGGVTYGNGSFLAVGDSGTIIQSDPVK
jgi:hypothetical protein